MSIWTIVLATLLSGAAGGIASALLLDETPEAATDAGTRAGIPPPLNRLAAAVSQAPWLLNMFLGVIAAFIVPLFLSLTQSTLVTQMLSQNKPDANMHHHGSLMIYIGFCLVASISFRRFVSGVSGQILSGLVLKAQRDAEENRARIEALEEATDNVGVEPEPRDRLAAMAAPMDAGNPPALTPAETKVLAALGSGQYRRRTASSVAKHLDLTRPEAIRHLRDLVGKHLARESVSAKTGNTLFEITPEGARVLASIEGGG